MKFKTPAAVEEIIWQMLLYEYERAQDRARINSLFNGAPPLTAKEAEENSIGKNVNDLSSTKIDHDARRQFDNAFVVPDPLWTVKLDWGPVYKKSDWSQIITNEANKIVSNSTDYLDLRQGVFASVVLHGIGPAMWVDRYKWLQDELGVEDVLIPGRTLRSLKNLPFFAIYRKYTGMELFKLTQQSNVDPAWNMPLVKKAIKWVDEQAAKLMSTHWPDQWYPEKLEERYKENGGMFVGDAVPTIDTYHFYYFDDDKKSSGWRRRIIMDAWGTPGVGGIAGMAAPGRVPDRPANRYDFSKDNFLYDSGDRVYAPNLNQILHFQFGDASAVAPFRYHSIRSLGFLLYAVCHLQNRLKCRFTDSVFESLMQYFRVASSADLERVSKVDLIDKGVVPEGVAFVRPEERWKIEGSLVGEAMQLNRQTMADVSSSFTSDFDLADEEQRGRETATRTMAKVNSTAALVGSMLNRAYSYEKFRQREIMRRFCIPNSKDPDVKKFRVNCLKRGVPEEALDIEKMDVQPNRVVGGGNKMLQVAIADKLMAVRPLHGPEAQHEILKFYDSVITDDYALASDLNPAQPHISRTIQNTEFAFNALMNDNPVSPMEGLNTTEVIETMLNLIEYKIQKISQQDNVGTPQDIVGFGNCEKYTQNYIQQLAQDPNEKERVAAYEKKLTALMNFVKAFQQRQEQMAKKMMQQQGGNGADPEAQQKLQFEAQKSQQKLEAQSQASAQRLAQRQLQYEQEEKRKDQEHMRDLQKADQKHATEVQQGAREHAAELIAGKAEHEAELAATERQAETDANVAKKKAEAKPAKKE